MLEILLVEDDEDDVHFIEAALAGEKCRIIQLTNGKQALDYLLDADNAPDIVLLDYHLPLLNGLQVLRETRASRKDIAFIFLTVDNTLDVAVEAMQAGALDFMPKIGKFYKRLPAMIAKVHAIHKDRVERKRAEQALRIERDNLNNMFEAMADGVCIVNQHYDVEYVNPALAKEFGPPLGEKCYTYFHDRDQVCPWCSSPDVFAGKTARIEWYSFKNQRMYDLVGTPLQNPDGSVSKLEIFRDITERVQAEEQLKTSLEEKKVLLRELYHRTKNNMQVICAMLALQAARVNDEQVSRIIQETENRIQSMALVHQKLYQSRNLSSINLNEYVRDLANLLVMSYNTSSDRIALVFDMSDISVLIDTAIPCGMILNELISNALKHAFPGGRQGEIRIRLGRMEQGEIELVVADNGIGAPAGMNFKNSDSLGLQTIFAVGENQLQGKVEFETRAGVTCRVHFRSDLYSARV